MPRNRRVGYAHLLLLTSLPLLSACGPSTGTVRGTVTIDGEPLTGGVISFVPAEATGTPTTANVETGKYELTTSTGKKFVQISAPIVVGKRKEYEGEGAPLVEITDERLPAKYNSQTELTFDVVPGPSTKDFPLTTERKK
jgi:hypothetical protein